MQSEKKQRRTWTPEEKAEICSPGSAVIDPVRVCPPIKSRTADAGHPRAVRGRPGWPPRHNHAQDWIRRTTDGNGRSASTSAAGFFKRIRLLQPQGDNIDCEVGVDGGPQERTDIALGTIKFVSITGVRAVDEQLAGNLLSTGVWESKCGTVQRRRRTTPSRTPVAIGRSQVGRHCCVGMSFASPGMPWLIRVKAIRAAAIGTGSFACMT